MRRQLTLFSRCHRIKEEASPWPPCRVILITERKAMKDCRQFYIDGEWVSPLHTQDFPVINPANEESIATISLGGAADVDRAVAAASKAFETFSQTSVDQRLAYLKRIVEIYESRLEEIGD